MQSEMASTKAKTAIFQIFIITPPFVSYRSAKFFRKFARPLFPLNPRNKELYEQFRIHSRANLNVRRHFLEALDHVVISMQHVFLEFIAPVRHGFPARK